MIFNSVTFLLFLTVVAVLYWRLPDSPRQWLLFISSLTFYGFWRIDFIAVLMLSVVVDFFAGKEIGRTENSAHKKKWLVLSLTANLGLLGFFKYGNFFLENLNTVLQRMQQPGIHFPWEILLPVGISFYTFQSMSYSLDIYRGLVKPQKNFLLFANYVLFFPQLVAGPILRAGEVIPQLRKRPPFSFGHLADGLERILYGMFVKVVLADNLAPLVDEAWGFPAGNLSPWDTLTLSILFGFQIYFDFCGYSHIALGTAGLFGLHFPENFNFPYLATSPREFWKRWHISLSSWVRDYLYLPLCRVKFQEQSAGGLERATTAKLEGRAVSALFISWFLMGLWHGANWTFVLWGLWHAALIFGYRLVQPLAGRLPGYYRVAGGWFLTTGLVFIGWIPFRSQSLDETLIRLKILSQFNPWFPNGILAQHYHWIAFFLLVSTILWGSVYPRWQKKLENPASVLTTGVKLFFYSTLFGLVFIFFRPINQFIYFQF